MGLKDKLTLDLRQALREGDETRKRTIRMLQAAILNEEKSGKAQRELSEDEMLGIVARQVKQRRESIAAYREANRQDLVQEEEAELSILLEYLPQQMTREDILAAARQAIADTEATGPQDMGKVMRSLMPTLKGRADGREVNQIVRELLTQAAQE